MPGSIREGGGLFGDCGLSGGSASEGKGAGVTSADQAADSHPAIINGTSKRRIIQASSQFLKGSR